MKVSIVGSLRDREVACSASDRQGSNFESCVWRTVSSQSSHHHQEVLLAQFSLYVHKGGLKPDSFHVISKATLDDIIKRYECVLEEAKRVARDNVCVSSILPRLTSAAYNTKADILNDKLKALCSDMQCTFIDHDINLRFQGGSVDDSVFTDNVHLNSKGLLRLINNLKLNDKIRAKKTFSHVSRPT